MEMRCWSRMSPCQGRMTNGCTGLCLKNSRDWFFCNGTALRATAVIDRLTCQDIGLWEDCGVDWGRGRVVFRGWKYYLYGIVVFTASWRLGKVLPWFHCLAIPSPQNQILTSIQYNRSLDGRSKNDEEKLFVCKERSILDISLPSLLRDEKYGQLEETHAMILKVSVDNRNHTGRSSRIRLR